MSFPGFQPSDESNRLNRVASLDWRKVRPQANSRFEFFLSARDLPFPAPKDKTINVGKRTTVSTESSSGVVVAVGTLRRKLCLRFGKLWFPW